jgi:hypothetical protein
VAQTKTLFLTALTGVSMLPRSVGAAPQMESAHPELSGLDSDNLIVERWCPVSPFSTRNQFRRNLSDVYAIFNTSVSGVNACYIRYNRASNLLYVANNAGSSWSAGIVPGSSGTAGNSYCTITGSGSSATGSGAQLALTVSVTFQTAFAGARNEYLEGVDNEALNTTWQQMGTWTVPGPQQYFLTTAASVEKWLNDANDGEWYFSVVSLGEIVKGITVLPASKRGYCSSP